MGASASRMSSVVRKPRSLPLATSSRTPSGWASLSDTMRSGTSPGACASALADVHNGPARGRSEEHTSELQSRPHLVCRLLLEKKNKQHFRIFQDHIKY